MVLLPTLSTNRTKVGKRSSFSKDLAEGLMGDLRTLKIDEIL